MWQLVAWGSSGVDWCEKNFIVADNIAEFYNTVSNILFLVMPPMLIYLFRQYSAKVSYGANLVFVLLFVVGIGSAYFHMTLSLLGQLIDEIAILWVLMVAIALWFPMRHIPGIFKGSRRLFQRIIFPISVVSTGLCCILPEVNAFILMLFGAPIVYLLVDEYRKCNHVRVRYLIMRSAILWFIAVWFWLNDRLFCETFWFQFPYLHSGWHIFIFIAAYTACVLFAYFHAFYEMPELGIELRYWPREGGLWESIGIPYVSFCCETPAKVC